MARNNETQIRNVLVVLGIMRKQYHVYDNEPIRTLRQNAIKNFAETELKKGRFTTLNSAVNSIHSACTRRIKKKTDEFDNLVETWLSESSRELEKTLINLAPKLETEIHKFFIQ